jgi:hypothetical protein
VAWEREGNRSYYYRSVRRRGHVVRECLGCGLEARLAAAIVQQRRQRQQAARQARRAAQEPWEEACLPVDELAAAVELLVSAALVGAGYYQRRGEWRRSRDGQSV